MELITIVEWITLVITVFMFLTGIPPCYQMYKSGCTKNVPFLLFLITTVSSSGMLHYGLILQNSTLIILNFIGATLNFSYAILYIGISSSKSRPLTHFLGSICYILGLYYYGYNIQVGGIDGLAQTLGLSSCVLTTIVACLPAFEIRENIKNQNADGMPQGMLLAAMACAISWSIYGGMLGDPNIYLPNIPGLACVFSKLAVVQMYAKPHQD